MVGGGILAQGGGIVNNKMYFWGGQGLGGVSLRKEIKTSCQTTSRGNGVWGGNKLEVGHPKSMEGNTRKHGRKG